MPITDASNAAIGDQIMTYREETDDSRTVVIRSPAEDDLAETTLLMNTEMVCCQPQFNLNLTYL